jgi:hypothetical protein
MLVHRHLKRLIADVVRDNLPPGVSDLPVDAVAEYYGSATVGLLQWWIDNDFVDGPTRMAAIHRRLTAPASPVVGVGS